MAVPYKGFGLKPAPYHLTEPDQWEVRVYISRHHDDRGETLQHDFTDTHTCGSEKEAEAMAIEFGKRIIDGECPGLGVEILL